MRDTPLNILLVEDSATHTELIRQALSAGFADATITNVGSLAEARRWLQHLSPDLLILDLMLPDGKGTALLQDYLDNPPFPSILLTSHGDEQAAVEAMKAGANDYLAKTAANLKRLPAVIRRTLREWHHICQHRIAEQSLRRSEEQFRRLFSNMMEAIAVDEIIVDAAGQPIDWRVTDVNPAYEEIFARSRNAVAGRKASELYGADFDHEQILRLFTRIQAGERSVSTELYLPYLDKHLLVSVFPLEAGKFATLSHDISERKRAELARERTLAELDATINAIADALIIYRPDGSIERMNPAAERLLDYTPETSRRTFPERISHLQVETATGRKYPLEHTLRRVFKGETLQGVIGVLRRGEGDAVWLSNSAAPIHDADGTLLGAVGTATDITALRQLQIQHDIYVHSISHDLRAPLTLIQGHAQLLQMTVPELKSSAMAQQNLAGIYNGVQRMTLMLEDLLDTARFEGGQLKLNKQPLHLTDFIERLRQSSFAILEEERLRIEIEADLPLLVADSDRLERMLMNLLTNAQKYSRPPAPITLSIDRHKEMIRFQVIDEGVGIAPEDLPYIFDRFYQPQSENRPDRVGLGLHIVKMLVDAHRGKVSVESTPGAGSCFGVLLPLE